MGVCFLMTKLLKNYEHSVNFQLLIKKSLTNCSGSRNFYAEHMADILLHRAAKKFFDNQNLERLPKMAELKQTFAEVFAEKKSLYSDYRPLKERSHALQVALYNVRRILGVENSENHNYGIAVDIARSNTILLIIVIYVSVKICGFNRAFGLNFSRKRSGGSGGEIEDFISVLSRTYRI
jgi:hypothetical protein